MGYTYTLKAKSQFLGELMMKTGFGYHGVANLGHPNRGELAMIAQGPPWEAPESCFGSRAVAPTAGTSCTAPGPNFSDCPIVGQWLYDLYG